MTPSERFNDYLNWIVKEIRKTNSEYGVAIRCKEVEEVDESEVLELGKVAQKVAIEATSKLQALNPISNPYFEFVPDCYKDLVVIFDRCEGKSPETLTSNLGITGRI